VSATGPLQSGIYNLVFEGSGGQISAIYVKVGQPVKKGDKLALLDPTALQDALAQQQAAYINAQNSYIVPRMSIADKRANWCNHLRCPGFSQ